MNAHPTIRFSAIGLNHPHIYSQVDMMLRAGTEFASFYAPEPDLADPFSQKFSQARRASSIADILEDESIQLVLSAAIPSERAPLGIAVMQHGKDYLSDKPAFTSLEQLDEARRVQAETNRICFVYFSERLENRATAKAGELVQAGAIGRVVQTIGMGPHRVGQIARPDWFYRREQYGGILTDLASHQVDQFLYFTNSTRAEVVASQVANYKFPEHPGLEDFGDMTLRSDSGTGYIRVDWYTPNGLNAFGDGRLTILGTEGFIEIRKYCDIGGRTGGNHLFLVDHNEARYIDCSDVDLPSGRQLVHDVIHRTQTMMPQAHAFLASELSIQAEHQAVRLGNLEKAN